MRNAAAKNLPSAPPEQLFHVLGPPSIRYLHVARDLFLYIVQSANFRVCASAEADGATALPPEQGYWNL